MAYGHTFARESGWESNFEYNFSVDGSVHSLIRDLQHICLGCQVGHIHYSNVAREQRALWMTFLISLMVRSPAFRHRYAAVDLEAGDTAKGEIANKYSMAQRIIQSKYGLDPIFFVLIINNNNKYTFGDGICEDITLNLFQNYFIGKCLISLTPRLTVYVRTRRNWRGDANCAVMEATENIVSNINEINQIFSKNMIFYRDHIPAISEAFRAKEHFVIKNRLDPFFDLLDRISASQ